MKKSTKLLSLIMALVMMICCASFSTTAFAADPTQCASVNFTGVENNSLIDDALIAINNGRMAKGKNAVVLDQALTDLAKQRAKELFVYYDSEDKLLPTGDSVASYFPTGLYSIMDYYYTLPDTETLNSCFSYRWYENEPDYANSVGIGFFTVDGNTIMYSIFSSAPAAAVYNNFVDAQVVASVYTNISNVQLQVDADTNQKYARYDLTVSFYFPNGRFYIEPTVSYDQLTITSSNSKVIKYKDGSLYPKKNGNTTISIILNSNPAVSYVNDMKFTSFNNIKGEIKSVKSSKKKTLKVQWYNNIRDAAGYEIQYSTNKKFPKSKTKTVVVKGKNKSAKTIKKLKSKKKYYVRVRAYVNQGNGEKAYSGWSKTKSVKIK